MQLIQCTHLICNTTLGCHFKFITEFIEFASVIVSISSTKHSIFIICQGEFLDNMSLAKTKRVDAVCTQPKKSLKRINLTTFCPLPG